jgi:hypothetical protein
MAEKGPTNAAGTFVGEIGEQIDDANEDNEAQRTPGVKRRNQRSTPMATPVGNENPVRLLLGYPPAGYGN